MSLQKEKKRREKERLRGFYDKHGRVQKWKSFRMIPHRPLIGQ